MHWCYIIVCFHYCLFSLNSASFIQIALFTSAPYRGQKFYHTVCDYVDEICHRLWPLFWILWLDVYILGQLPVKQSPPLLLCFWQRLRFKNRGGCGFFACSWCMLISFFFFCSGCLRSRLQGKNWWYYYPFVEPMSSQRKPSLCHFSLMFATGLRRSVSLCAWPWHSISSGLVTVLRALLPTYNEMPYCGQWLWLCCVLASNCLCLESARFGVTRCWLVVP